MAKFLCCVSPLYESRLIQFRLGYTKKTLLAEVTEIEPMMGDNTDLNMQSIFIDEDKDD